MTHDIHPELAGLLAGLQESPADDALWLIAADWLEEHGQDGQAELMRLSRGLPSLPRGPRLKAEKRIRELIAGGVRPCVPEITNALGMRFALIPPGDFLMGSPASEVGRWADEKPRHRVTLTRAYWMGVFPVTQAQYWAVMRKSPSSFRAHGAKAEKVRGLDTRHFPVESVSWHSAVEFCRRLSARAPGLEYCLPTEAEWEHACRAGLMSGMYHFGDDIGPENLNYEPSGLNRPCPVGSYPPNAFGLHDMHGNVWEWCSGTGKRYTRGHAIDPDGGTEGERRAYRGGCWCADFELARAAVRDVVDADSEDDYVGFRVAATVTPPPSPAPGAAPASGRRARGGSSSSGTGAR